MPHFVVKKNNIHSGNNVPSYAIEWEHHCKDLNGSRYEHTCYEIDETTARKPLNTLINLHQSGVRPKKKGPDVV